MSRMQEFKIEYDPTYSRKYTIYRKDYKDFGFRWVWNEVGRFETIEQAETELQEFKKFPKYYGW